MKHNAHIIQLALLPTKVFLFHTMELNEQYFKAFHTELHNFQVVLLPERV